jgi:hypothetical protein
MAEAGTSKEDCYIFFKIEYPIVSWSGNMRRQRKVAKNSQLEIRTVALSFLLT